MIRRRTQVLLASGTAVLLLVLLLPSLLRGSIERAAQGWIGRSIEADVSWQGAGLSLLRNFPRATLRLDDVAVVGRGAFAGDTLARLGRLRVAVSLPSVFHVVRGTGPLTVSALEVDRPAVHLLMLEDGTANWDLVRGDAGPAAEAGAVALRLRGFRIRDGAIRLENRQARLAASIAGLGQTLSGDFDRNQFTVRSHTAADAVSLRLAGVPYLARVGLAVDAEVDVDRDAGSVTLAGGSIRLNELLLSLAGRVGIGGDTTTLDLSFDAPGTSLRHLLSLVPALGTQPGFAELQASGEVAVAGYVRGGYGPNAFPAFEVKASVRDGQFRFPDLPLPARDVFLDVAATNAGGHLDSTRVQVDRFNVVIGSDAVTGSFGMRTPVSDPDIDLRLAGKLDLAELERTIRLAGTDELAGSIVVNVEGAGRRSDLDAGRHDRIRAAGSVGAAGVVLRMAELPHAVELEEGMLHLSPQHAELETLRGTIGSSDVDVTGRLDNLFGFLFLAEELRGTARIASRVFDLDEWRSDDELKAVRVPGRIDVALDARVVRLRLAGLDLGNAHGALRVRDERAELDDFGLEVFGGTLALDGFYETTTPERPTFDMALRVDSIDVAQAALSVAAFRAVAPAARYARGRMSSELRLSGALGEDMTPALDVLAGQGSFATAGLAVEGFPPLQQLAERLQAEQLRNPTMVDLRSSFRIVDGRLHVSPFNVRLGEFAATVSGSHGFDETLDYTIALQVPRAVLGSGAQQAVATLASQAGRAGVDWAASDVITLGVQLGGTVTRPAIGMDLRATGAAVLEDAGRVFRSELERSAQAVEQQADAALEEARLRAEQEAARLVAEAEAQAARIRAEAEAVAETVRREGNERAEALVAQAGSNPAARLAAGAAADRIRREADAAAERILREADERATALVAGARQRGGGPG